METFEFEDPPTATELVGAFCQRCGAFALESTQSRYGLGEWSFYGAEPFARIEGAGVELDDFRSEMSSLTAAGHGWIPFCGGAVGYLSYDYGRRLESLPCKATDDRNLPDLSFGVYDGVAALHHPTGRVFLTAHGRSGRPSTTIDRMRQWVDQAQVSTEESVELSDWQWNMTEADFISAVNRVREYIRSGDIYQANLSRRARCQFKGDPLTVYRALRAANPAPYSAFIRGQELTIISTSPEQFIRKRGRDLETRPIKGTVARGRNEVEDVVNEAQLKGSEKERAELLMIVDLERNDLGRVSEFGSVRVEGLYRLERYASVIHQTAQVKGLLCQDLDIYDVLKNIFPGGSITGAPKLRAMEIIEELEPTRRGVYCGGIGYVGFDGDSEFSIAIRTLHHWREHLDYQAGSGIVWDSDPLGELQETLDKARAIREALDRLCRK